MKKIIACLIGVLYLANTISITFAITSKSAPESDHSPALTFPAGEDFQRLQKIISETFSDWNDRHYYSYGQCIMGGATCPNYKYTVITEKAIKLIVTKTFTGNEAFYQKLFRTHQYDTEKSNFTLSNALASVPMGTAVNVFSLYGNKQSISDNLLESSFHINIAWNEPTGMLDVIDQKIQRIIRDRCNQYFSSNEGMASMCIEKKLFAPSLEELLQESIYLNREEVPLRTLANEFQYIPHTKTYISFLLGKIHAQMGVLDNNLQKLYNHPLYKSYQSGSFDLSQLSSAEVNSLTHSGILNIGTFDDDIKEICADIRKNSVQKNIFQNIATTLLRANSSSRSNNNTTPYNMQNNVSVMDRKCGTLASQIDDTKSVMESIQNMIIEMQSSLPGGAYALTYTKDSYSLEEAKSKAESVDPNTLIKNYNDRLQGKTIPKIPKIFETIPRDDIVLYVKHAEDLQHFLDSSAGVIMENTGIDNKKAIDTFIQNVFWKETLESVLGTIHSDFVIVASNLDVTHPEIAIIVNKADASALSANPELHAITKDWFTIFSHSKFLAEKIQKITTNTSLASASDFQYVWMKKSEKIQSALIFVGDAFFAKMLDFQNLIQHIRKYKAYSELMQVQELQWAYYEAFWRYFTSFDELKNMGFANDSEVFQNYSIATNGEIVHAQIGTIKDPKILSEIQFDPHYSRGEIDKYRESIGEYREVWQATLDPMGVILNKESTGFSIDFFMTPVPELTWDAQVLNTFKNFSKEKLDFLSNMKIRNGILSVVFGADIGKIRASSNVMVQEVLSYANEETKYTQGKNILDMISGEFALSLGSIDVDFLDGYNPEKIDIYASVGVKDAEKWRELTEILRKLIVDNIGAFDTRIAGMFAKPLIEDYRGNRIYYIENIPIPFIGNIGFTYSVVENFVIFSLNRTTIKKIIDISHDGDTRKIAITGGAAPEKYTVLGMIFDGQTTKQNISKFFDANTASGSISRANIYQLNELVQEWSRTINAMIFSYYLKQYWNDKIKNRALTENTLNIGVIKTHGNVENILVSIDENALKEHIWETFWKEYLAQKNKGKLPPELFTTGVSLEQFQKVIATSQIGSYIFLSAVAPSNTDSTLLSDMVFNLVLDGDEIWFTLHVQNQNATKNIHLSGSSSKELLFLAWLIVFAIALLGGIGFFMYRHPQVPHTENTIEN